MKPIIVRASKDKNGRELVTMTLAEFEAAIDNAYDSGIIDGRRQVEEALRAATKPLEVLKSDDGIRVV